MAVQVLKGKNNFLFLKDDSNGVLQQVTGKIPLNSTDLMDWSKVMQDRLDHSQKHGYQYFYFLAPNKHCVYEEFLPDNLHISENRSARQLQRSFPSLVHYPLDILRDNRAQGLYYSHDTHWNQLGAVIVFNDFFGRLTGNKIHFEIYKATRHGDLGDKLDPIQLEDSTFIRYTPKSRIVYDNHIHNIGHIIVTSNMDTSLPTAVIFGDSFFADMLLIISEYFGKLYFFHAPVFDKWIIEKIRPDMVISENVERFVNKPHVESTFREEVYKKYYSARFAQIKRLQEVSCPPDGITDIDYDMLAEWTRLLARCKSDTELESLKAAFLTEHNLCKYLPSRIAYFTGHLWHANSDNKFIGWGACFRFDRPKSPLGVAFYLESVMANGKFKIQIYEASQNLKIVKPMRLKQIYEKYYKSDQLAIYSPIQEVFFPFEQLNLKPQCCYLVTVEGNARLGCGKSYQDLHEENYLYRGYYRQSPNSEFQAVKKNESIAWRLIYPD